MKRTQTSPAVNTQLEALGQSSNPLCIDCVSLQQMETAACCVCMCVRMCIRVWKFLGSLCALHKMTSGVWGADILEPGQPNSPLYIHYGITPKPSLSFNVSLGKTHSGFAPTESIQSTFENF